MFGVSDWQAALLQFGVDQSSIDGWQFATLLAEMHPDFIYLSKALIADASYPVSQLPELDERIVEVFVRMQRPLALKELVETILAAESAVDLEPATIAAYLRLSTNLATVETGGLLPASWQLRRTPRIVQVLFEHGDPLHYEQLTVLLNARLPDGKQMDARAVHSRLDYNKETFVRVGHGIYGRISSIY
jgi:hypothetical protein